jgi:preprotein translocase subunit SecG
MFGFLAHVLFVVLCLGLGYMIRYSMEEFKELDRHIECMNEPERAVNSQGSAQHNAQTVPGLANELQAKADPAKLAELKASIKK